MGSTDHQIGFVNESTYNTAVTVTDFFEYESESITQTAGRTEGDPLRTGSRYIREDRFTPYFSGAAGNVQLAVMTKGFGYLLQHLTGSVATAGPTDSGYVHTATEGALLGKFFTCQANRPLHPSGADQAFTYSGGKVTDWGLSNSVDGNLLLDLGLDFAGVSTGVAKASASYPSGMENFTWAGGVVTVGGSAVDVTEFAVNVANGLNVDRRQIRGNTDKKEPTEGRREATFSLKADFASLAEHDRVHAATRAGALAEIVATWTGPTLLGSTTYPTVTVTIPAARFDSWAGNASSPDGIEQDLSGVARYDGSSSPITVAYGTLDVTP